MKPTIARTGNRRWLRLAITLLFVYGGLTYSLSLLEYTNFQLTGTSTTGIDRVLSTLSDDQLKQEMLACGRLMNGAGGMTKTLGEPMIARCGRFWPFYRYSIELPAHPAIPNAFIVYADEAPAITDARQRAIDNIRLVNGAWAIVALLVLGLSIWTGWLLLAKKDENQAWRRGIQTFISSLLMVLVYVGLMFYVDPQFGTGW